MSDIIRDRYPHASEGILMNFDLQVKQVLELLDNEPSRDDSAAWAQHQKHVDANGIRLRHILESLEDNGRSPPLKPPYTCQKGNLVIPYSGGVWIVYRDQLPARAMPQKTTSTPQVPSPPEEKSRFVSLNHN